MKIIKSIHGYDSSIDEDFDSRYNLSFKEGDLIFLKNKIDDDWGEGFNISEDGNFFPLNFTDKGEEKTRRVKAYPVKRGSEPQGVKVEARMISKSSQMKKSKSSQMKKSKSSQMKKSKSKKRKSKKRKSKKRKSKKYTRRNKK